MTYPVPYGHDPMPVEPVANPPKPCNHLLHFFLGFVTCGIWWLVWPILAIMANQESQAYLKWYAEARCRYQVNLVDWKRRNGLV